MECWADRLHHHHRLYDEGLLFTLRDPDNTIIFGQVQDRNFVLKKILAMKAQVCVQTFVSNVD